MFQEVLLQFVQQGVRFPHVGFLQKGLMAPLIECPPPCGFEFLPEFPPNGFDLLFEILEEQSDTRY